MILVHVCGEKVVIKRITKGPISQVIIVVYVFCVCVKIEEDAVNSNLCVYIGYLHCTVVKS